MEGLLELTASALRLGIPVAICALGALWSERSGVINIGMEGMMLTVRSGVRPAHSGTVRP